MNPFERGRAVMHRDPSRSVEATYTPAGGGQPVQLRVIRSSPDLDTDIGGDRIRSSAEVFSVTQADVPLRPTEGAMVTVGSSSWQAYDAQPDAMGLTWRMFCTPA